MPSTHLPIILGLTGASGSILGLRLLKELLLAGRAVDLVMSQHASLVMQQEMGVSITGKNADEKRDSLLTILKLEASTFADQLTILMNNDIGARPASGTFLHGGMVIAPCSMGTLAKIRHGMSDSLLTRAADVTLKESRPLILLPRETPLNSIHLDNMHALSMMGVKLIPPMLSFYSPDFLSLEGQLVYTVGKTLDHLGVDHSLFTRWQGLGSAIKGEALQAVYANLI